MGVLANCCAGFAPLLLPTADAWTRALPAVWGTGAGLAWGLLGLGWGWRGVPIGVLASLGPPTSASPEVANQQAALRNKFMGVSAASHVF